MMGSDDKPQNELFYAFNLEDLVPQDHLLRSIDRFLDFTYLREHLAAYARPHRATLGRSRADDSHAVDRLLPGHSLGTPTV